MLTPFDYAFAEIVPIPSKKPMIELKESSTQKVVSNETSLISFALKPDQIDLDPSLEKFLLDHVVKLSQNNPDLKIEIQAYATSEDKQEHSDIRRSLARGLEVRRFLMSKDIAPNRLTLSAMGQDENNKSDNRIDLLFTASQ